MPEPIRHYWWHHAGTGGYYAVALDDGGRIASAWIQVDRAKNQWIPLDDFRLLVRADKRGDIHRNPHGFTDELEPSA